MPRRDNIMIGTAGHVDHGKTSLVRMLTGCETDTLREEKERGMSIDLGFAPCQLPDGRIVGIVDVPGHEKFIRNMVAGATGIDMVLLVVAADDGVMPQTLEHLDVLLLLGVRHGLVALTKIDLVTPEHAEMAAEGVRELLAGTALEGCPICPVSNETLEGLGDLNRVLGEVAGRCEPRPADGIFRLAAERAFSAEGFGTIATGIPCSGQVRLGDTLEAFDPAGNPRLARVRRLEVYGREADTALCGQCVAVNLVGARPAEVGRGCVLATPGYVQPVRHLELALRLANRPSIRPLKQRAEVHFHTGTMVSMGRVTFLDCAGPLPPGGAALAQIHLLEPLVIGVGDRFVIRGPDARAGLRVIGGGRVIGTSGHHLKSRAWVVADLSRWEAALDSPTALLAEAVRQARTGTPPADAARAALLPARAAEELGERLLAEGVLVKTPEGHWAHASRVAEMADEVCQRLAAFHAAQPQVVGPAAADLRRELDVPEGFLSLVIGQAVAEGRVVRQGDWLRLRTHTLSLSEPQMALQQRVEAALAEGGFCPPAPDALAATLGVPEKEVRNALARLTQQIAVVHLGDLWFHRDAIVRAAERVRQLFAERKTFTTMDFRDALGTSRKYAVPILDYLDSLRLTRRNGNQRTPGPALASGAGPVPPASGTS
ncbi:MAG TPA: selenocysteine-specific translation elongation factor [Planctomycetota bacterium]|nr:selenocysteine-specific translation elongation factor [Planctomycetota bacterium]HRR83018.1 selenocysteine-specific translation elongation factor [Planctomycetota bacterium]